MIKKRHILIEMLVLAIIAVSIGFTVADDELSGFGADSYHIIKSSDLHSVSAYSDESVGLINMIKTEIGAFDDTLQKTRNTAMFSFGADMLNIKDESYLSLQDALGQIHGSGYDKSVLLQGCDIPFALVREDLFKLSDEGNIVLANSMTNILLPTTDEGNSKVNNIASALSKAFGDSSEITIKKFIWDGKNTFDTSSMLNELNIEKYFSSDEVKDLMNAFNDPEMLALLEAARDSARQPSVDRKDTRYYDSLGGMSCRWGYS
jgi:hypothetical protein